MSRFTLAVVSALLAGYIIGKVFSPDFGQAYEWALYVLIFLIGVDLGMSAAPKRALKARALFLPLATLIGSLAGAVLASLLTHTPLKYSLAIGAGCGWYSLTGPLIAQYSPIYGSLGFLGNLFREIFTVLFYPVLVRKLPAEPLVSIGGATTMDTTLGIIAKAGGREVALTAFVHGFILTAIAPFLIPLILGAFGS